MDKTLLQGLQKISITVNRFFKVSILYFPGKLPACSSLMIAISLSIFQFRVGTLRPPGQIWFITWYVNKAVLKHSHTHAFTFHLGSFCSTKSELSSCDRDLWPTNPEIFTIWPFPEKACTLDHLLLDLKHFFFFFHFQTNGRLLLPQEPLPTEQCARWFWRKKSVG